MGYELSPKLDQTIDDAILHDSSDPKIWYFLRKIVTSLKASKNSIPGDLLGRLPISMGYVSVENWNQPNEGYRIQDGNKYNVASVSRTGRGNCRITFAAPRASNKYLVFLTPRVGSGTLAISARTIAQARTHFDVTTERATGEAAVTVGFHFIAYGIE